MEHIKICLHIRLRGNGLCFSEQMASVYCLCDIPIVVVVVLSSSSSSAAASVGAGGEISLLACLYIIVSSTCSSRNALLIRIWISSTTGTSCTLLVTLTAVSRT